MVCGVDIGHKAGLMPYIKIVLKMGYMGWLLLSVSLALVEEGGRVKRGPVSTVKCILGCMAAWGMQ